MNVNQIAASLFALSILTLTPTACARQPGLPSTPPTDTPGAGDTPISLPTFSHVFIIVLENKEASTIIGSPDAPYLNGLAKQYARATQFYGIRHPSLPNYLALTGGSTFNVSSDCTDCFINAPSIADQIETAGRSWKAYMESMPQPCFVGNAGSLYAQKHNPFIYYDDIRTDPARCNKIVPLDQLAADLQANALPDYAWITPNLCDDMHDCPVSAGDNWLQTWVPRILASPAWKDKGVLFVTFDEGTSGAGAVCGDAAGGYVDTLVISPLVQPGFTSSVPYDHYALLHTIEAAWGLPLLGSASGGCAVPMSDFFAATRPSTERK
jgi:acid phosphatase